MPAGVCPRATHLTVILYKAHVWRLFAATLGWQMVTILLMQRMASTAALSSLHVAKPLSPMAMKVCVAMGSSSASGLAQCCTVVNKNAHVSICKFVGLVGRLWKEKAEDWVQVHNIALAQAADL